MKSKKELLGLRIKEFREKRKLTQDKLAETVGIDPKHLSRIENGSRNPSIKLLQRLAAGMNMDLRIAFVPRV